MADNVCQSKKMAVQIIETLLEGMNSGVQRNALTSVLEFVRDRLDDIPDDAEEIKKQIAEYYEDERRLMSAEELRERADFYLAGIMPKEKFEAMTPEEKDAYFKNGGLSIHIA